MLRSWGHDEHGPLWLSLGETKHTTKDTLKFTQTWGEPLPLNRSNTKVISDC